MSKTIKDKNKKYLRPDEIPFRRQQGPNLSRRYANFKKYGPSACDDRCFECGGAMESQRGYLTCGECGMNEDVVHFMERWAA
jgi:hypothetical protein